jgi:hypothetical protein
MLYGNRVGHLVYSNSSIRDNMFIYCFLLHSAQNIHHSCISYILNIRVSDTPEVWEVPASLGAPAVLLLNDDEIKDLLEAQVPKNTKEKTKTDLDIQCI